MVFFFGIGCDGGVYIEIWVFWVFCGVLENRRGDPMVLRGFCNFGRFTIYPRNPNIWCVRVRTECPGMCPVDSSHQDVPQPYKL